MPRGGGIGWEQVKREGGIWMAMTVFWVAMVVISLVCGLATGNLSQVSQAAAEGAQSAVTLCISMAGMLCLWNGVLEVMNRSGLTQKLRVDFIPGIRPGDYVMVHAGFAIEKLTEQQARENLACIQEALDALD